MMMSKTNQYPLSELEKELKVKEIYEKDPAFWLAVKQGNFDSFLKAVGDLKWKSGSFSDAVTYRIPKAEVKEILRRLDWNEASFQNMDYETIVNYYPNLYGMLPKESLTLERIPVMIKKGKDDFYFFLPDDLQAKFRSVYISTQTDLSRFSEVELLDAILLEPSVFPHIKEEQMTQTLLDTFLDTCVSRGLNLQASLGMYYWDNVPEHLKDAHYYQTRALLNALYLRDVPKEYLTSELVSQCVSRSFLEGRPYTMPLILLDSFAAGRVPDEFLTEEIALRCCAAHFSGVTKLPKRFRTDSFYEKLMERGQYTFLCEVDFSTISTGLLAKGLEMLSKTHTGQFSFWHKKIPAEIWTDDVLMAYAKASYCFLTHAPKNKITKELVLTNIRHQHISFEDIPSSLIDLDVVELFVSLRAYGQISKIPDVYKTPDFWERHVRAGHIPLKFVPKDILTEELLCAYEQSGGSIDFDFLPNQLLTKERITKQILGGGDVYLSQSSQTAAITRILFEAYQQRGDLEKHLYMLGNVDESLARDLLHILPAKTIAKGLYAHYSLAVSEILVQADPECIVFLPEEHKPQLRTMDCVKQASRVPKKVKSQQKTSHKSSRPMVAIPEHYTQMTLFDCFPQLV
jgi:hypothetical protein